MEKCKSCGNPIKSGWLLVEEYCPSCKAKMEERTIIERRNLISNLAKKYTNIENAQLVGIGYWDAVNRQSLSKNLEQELIGGLFGGIWGQMLMKTKEFAGKIGLITIKKNELIFVELGLAPLGGIDLNSLYITEDTLKTFLEGENKFTKTKVPLSELTAEVSTVSTEPPRNVLNINGGINVSINVSVPFENFAGSNSIADAINGISNYMPPYILLKNIISNNKIPTNSDLVSMASNEFYMKKFGSQYSILNKKEKIIILENLAKLPEDFNQKIKEFFQQKSVDADKFPISAVILVISLIGIIVGVLNLIISPTESGLPEISAIVLGVGFSIFSFIFFTDRIDQRWYRDHLYFFE